jgi:hypothetical protein
MSTQRRSVAEAAGIPTLGTAATSCRFCGSAAGELVADMGCQPACDHFPLASEPGSDPVFPVQVWLCASCQLTQLVADPTLPEEVRGVEPAAFVEQARDAVARVAEAGLLSGAGSVDEFGSPHGGSWLDLLAERGVRPRSGFTADVVLDCFGLMHEPDLRAALSERTGRLAPGGVLLVQYHSLAAIVEHGQWNIFRHGHPVYLSTPAVVGLLHAVGLTAVRAWQFELLGGTVLLAARRGGRPDASVEQLVEDERAAGVCEPEVLNGLERTAAESAGSLRRWLVQARAEGRTVLGYGAASRAVPLLNRAGIGPDLLEAVADASPAKNGRRIPGVRIPIVSVDELVVRAPDDILLLVPDLLTEVQRTLGPALEKTRWVVAEPRPRAVESRPARDA